MTEADTDINQAHREKMAKIKAVKDKIYASKTKEKGLLKEREDEDEGNKDIVAELPPNIKEDALVRLAECGYDIDAFQSTLRRIKPTEYVLQLLCS